MSSTGINENTEVVTDRIYVSFLVGKESFGMPIDEVMQIIRVPQITKVPKTSEFILGMSNLRGVVLPVVDLSLRLGYGKKCEITEDSRIIVIEKSNTLTGILVESVNEVKSAEVKEIDQIPEILNSEIDKKFIGGILKTGTKDKKQLIQILNIEEIVNIKEILKSQGRSAGSIRQASFDDEKGHVADEKRFISFNIDTQEYSLPIENIKEIIRMPEKVSVPGLPPYVMGIFSLRGEVFPLISLHAKFDRKQGVVEDDNTRIVITELRGTSVGFAVDKVNEVVRVDESLIEEPPRMFTGEDKSELSAIIKLNSGKRLIMILDTKHLLSKDEIEALNRVAEKEGRKSAMQDDSGNNLEEEIQVVTFKIEHEEYGILIEKVQEINRFTNVTSIPKTPKFVEGIINLRGEVIPLVDLRKRFELSDKERDEFTRVIIVNLSKMKLGFIVDSVDEVLRVSESSIDQVPPMLSGNIESEFINGVINVGKNNRMILLLNIDELFSKKEINSLEGIKTS